MTHGIAYDLPAYLRSHTAQTNFSIFLHSATSTNLGTILCFVLTKSLMGLEERALTIVTPLIPSLMGEEAILPGNQRECINFQSAKPAKATVFETCDEINLIRKQPFGCVLAFDMLILDKTKHVPREDISKPLAKCAYLRIFCFF